MSINLSQMCDRVIGSLAKDGVRPRLLLHSCCAPCSSYVTEYLLPYFDLTLFFYNPNIFPFEEFQKRYSELVRYVNERFNGEIKIICPEWDHREFLSFADGLCEEPEGGERCLKCYALRLEATARAAAAGKFPFYCTTLSVSPHKNAVALYEIANALGEKAGVTYLPSDFKKKDGYKRSIELSREYGLYRQDFCGCPFSEIEAKKKRERRSTE